MKEHEVEELLQIVKIHYQNFSIYDSLRDEWFRILKNYSANEVLDNLDKYLEDDRNRERIPMVFDLKKGLLTLDKKERFKNDYLIDCNLCHKTMFLSEYDNTHHRKCLLIKTIIKDYKKKNQNIAYEELDKFSFEELDKRFSLKKKKIEEVYQKI